MENGLGAPASHPRRASPSSRFGAAVRLTAHAKINWFLEITGRRADGYHTLSTVFQTISLGDRLSFRPAAELRLTCSHPGLPCDDSNLVLRAARALRERLKEPRGAAIHLEKIVPMGAGLGGGSADAAATLRGLCRLWRRRADASTLRRLALKLGADVPFFLEGGTCRATGIGEALTPLKPVPKTWLVIVWPGFGISTKEAYAKVRLPLPDRRRPPAGLPLPLREGLKARGSDPLFNRFEPLVFPAHPELRQLKQRLLDLGASAALLSGSGSAVFGAVDSKNQGQALLARIQKRYTHSWLAHTV